MATTATIYFDLADILGADFDARRTRVRVSTNIPDDTLIDTAVGQEQIRLGDGKVTVNADGSGIFTTWVPGPTMNPATWQTYVHVDYLKGGRERTTRTFGPFTITASANLADLVDEQEMPPTYLSTLTESFDAKLLAASASAESAAAAAALAEAISGADTADELITILDANPASVLRVQHDARHRAEAIAAKVDPYAIQRVDRRAMTKAREGGGAAAIAYSDAAELTQSWANLTGWQAAANAQVASSQLFAVDGTQPAGALKSFPIATGETAHIATVLHWKSGSTTAPLYFGVDLGTPDHAPATSSPDGVFIGLSAAGAINVFKGANLDGITVSGPTHMGATSVSSNNDFYVSIDVLTDFVSLTIRNIAAPEHVSYAYFSRAQVASAGKSINNIAAFVQDARGLAGHSFGPIAAVKSRQPARTKTLGGRTVEGLVHRLIPTAPYPGGDAWRIQLPKLYDPRRPAPVVIYHHQSLSGTQDTPWSEARARPLVEALSNAGYIVASANDGGDRWGNRDSINNYLALYEHIRDRWNTGPLFLLGVSMGFLPVLNALARRDLPTPAGVVSIGGVCDLDLLWAQGAYDDGIAAAYAISGPDAPDSEYESKTAGWNPMDREGWEFRGVPMRFYSGASDTIVTTAGNATALAAKVAPYVPEATVVAMPGAHLDTGHFVADIDADAALDIVEFFDSYR